MTVGGCPKVLTFVRHAESVANAGGRTLPHAEIPLSERGRRQAELLADCLPYSPSSIFVSTFSRTGETARPLCDRLRLSPRPLAELNEFSCLDHSMLEGMTGAERRPLALRYWDEANPSERTGPLADTFTEFDERVSKFLETLDIYTSKSLFIGHGIWIGLAVWKLLGFSSNGSEGMRAFRRFQSALPMPNCAAYQIVQEGSGRWRVEAIELVAIKCRCPN